MRRDRRIWAALIVLVGIGASATMYYLPVPGTASTFDGSVERELPDQAYAGESTNVKLHFDLPDTRNVTVVETVTVDGTTVQNTVPITNIRDDTILYQITMPEAAGVAEFSGRIAEHNVTVSGASTVPVNATDTAEDRPIAALLPEAVGDFTRTDFTRQEQPDGDAVERATATYTGSQGEHTVTIARYGTEAAAFDARDQAVFQDSAEGADGEQSFERTTVGGENAYRRASGDDIIWVQADLLYTVSGPAADTLADAVWEVYW